MGRFYPLFEDRGYICLFPNGRELSCVKGSLVNHLQYWSKFLMEGLKDYWLKFVCASGLVGV